MNHLAYTGRGSATLLAVGSAAALWLGAFGCTAGVKMSTAGTGGSGATVGQGGSGATGGSGTGGRLVVTGSGGGGGDIVMTGTGGMISPDGGCMADKLTHTPTLPTVFILVDRSGSEFDSNTTGTFFTLRPAVEQVLNNLDSKVRFGFGAFVGNGGNPNCTVDFADTVVPIALNNATAITTEYDMLGPLQPYGSKANTPMSDVIPMIKSLLVADESVATGSKYLLVVTDSETDFCDDGSAICPADAMIYKIQDLYASGFGTLVIGLPPDASSGTSDPIAPTVLQDFANAGAGQAVVVPQPNAGQTIGSSDIYDQCGSAGYNPSTNTWLSVYTSAGHTATQHTSIATYSATGGSATVYTPSGTDTQALNDEISAALNTIPPSCVFDLSSLNNPIKVDLTKLSEGGVFLNGMPVPLDPNNMNGWDMISDTQLELFGSACTTYQNTGSTESLNLEFPCDLVITVDKP